MLANAAATKIAMSATTAADTASAGAAAALKQANQLQPPQSQPAPAPRARTTSAHLAPDDALSPLDNTRIASIRPLLPPLLLLDEVPLTPSAAHTVAHARRAVQAIVEARDDRLLVVVGPCSIHDVGAARDYARRIKEVAANVQGELLVVMRVYFEKPRTTTGWKGLINDPDLNGTFNINKGLRVARQLLVDLNGDLGMPCAGECLDTISPQYIADLYAWAAIGARTTASQVHRELASGLSMPVGFKNDTTGDVGVAADAILSASSPHHFLSVTKQGLSAIVATSGNPHAHAILRGGSGGPNYDAASVTRAVQVLEKRGKGQTCTRVMVDCSHGNSGKDHARQPGVVESVAEQVEAASKVNPILGVMLESNISAGRQDHDESAPDADPGKLQYGVSITDACMDFMTTAKCLERLAVAVRRRRERLGRGGTEAGHMDAEAAM